MAGLFSRLSQRVLAPDATVQPVCSESWAAGAGTLQTVTSWHDAPAPAERPAMVSANAPIAAARPDFVATADDLTARNPVARPRRPRRPRSPNADRTNAEAALAHVPVDRPSPPGRPVERDIQSERELPRIAGSRTPARVEAFERVETLRHDLPLAERGERLRDVRAQPSPGAVRPIVQERTSTGEAPQAPVVHVTIDRIDVHQPPAPQPRLSPAPSTAPRISLADYLGGVQRRSP